MISVVIPAYNAEHTLGAGLRALLAQIEQWPQPVEVIVVDDGSQDGTAALAQALGVRVITPVSYTHLDVYKRQPFFRPIARSRRHAQASLIRQAADNGHG